MPSVATPLRHGGSRYRFGPFVLSPRMRVLLRGSEELRLIPRYFDLLLLLVERRPEAVHRREIFDAVWSDVVVSDSALTQAVRTLRRTLGDDPRDPQYIRTVSRHGYRFVCAQVALEPDDGSALPGPGPPGPTSSAPEGRLETAVDLLLSSPAATEEDDVARREAAEILHQAGTQEALARLDGRPGHERARAHLRDSRWDVLGAGPVPLLGVPGGVRALMILFGLRLRRASRLAQERCLRASFGGGAAGLFAGLLGGTVLWLGPGSRANSTAPVVLAFLGGVVGALGAAGVGAGLAAAEVLVRSWRRLSLCLFGALGGGTVGVLAHGIGQWTVRGLFGRDLSPVGGGFEGLFVGGAVGWAYATATPRSEGGMATPRGADRLRVALATGAAGSLAAACLAATGSHLGAMSLDFMTRSFPNALVSFDPLARLLGESTPGTVTRIVIGAGEGLLFGFGLAWGLTRRPRHSPPGVAVVVVILLASVSTSARGDDYWARPRRGANFFNQVETRERFAAAAAAGIEFVRLAPDKWPGSGRDFLLGDADAFRGVPPADLAKLRRALDDAAATSRKVVLTMLSLPGARWRQHNDQRSDFRLYREEAYALQAEAFWRELAAALRGHPALVGYNLLNEPHPELAAGPADYWAFDFAAHGRRVAGSLADLNALYARLVRAVRAGDPDAFIVIDTGLYATPWAIEALAPLPDPRVLYSVHMYEPFAYTNHKQSRGRFRYPGPVPDDGDASGPAVRDWNADALRGFFAKVVAWQQRHQVPSSRILVGEFGVDRRAPGAERYLAELIALFEERSWHWAFYAFREDTWDAMDYEIGPGPLPASYWKEVEAGRTPHPPRRPNRLWDAIKRGLAAGRAQPDGASWRLRLDRLRLALLADVPGGLGSPAASPTVDGQPHAQE